MKNINPTDTQAWKALEAHQSQLALPRLLICLSKKKIVLMTIL